MRILSKLVIYKLVLILNLFIYSHTFSDNHNFYEVIEKLQKDIKTLEKAVYSGSVNFSNNDQSSNSFSEGTPMVPLEVALDETTNITLVFVKP